MRERRRAPVQKRADDCCDGPGAIAVEKLEASDVSVKKRIVRRGGKYCVLAETSDRSFGCYSSKGEAERRLGQIEAFSRKTATKAAPHVHTFTVGGTQLVTSTNGGPKHSHQVTLPSGKVATVTSAGDGASHTHTLTYDGKSVTSSGPKAEDAPAKKTRTSKALPDVLTFDAVCKGEMPPHGESGLPTSLEQDVPPRYRFWKCEDASDALEVRRALVEACVFTPENIRVVNGELRRVVVKVQKSLALEVFKSEESPVVPAAERPVVKMARHLSDGDECRLFDSDVVAAFGFEAVLEKASALGTDYVIAAEDTPEVRKAMRMAGGAFSVRTLPGIVFATNAQVESHPLIECVEMSRSDELIEKARAGGVRLLVKAEKEDERIVYGVVLEPEVVDKQDDVVSAEEIRSAAYKFMEDFGVLGLQHEEAINGRVKLLESFIAPTTFKVGKDTIKKGSWVMAERIIDDELWAAVKAGDITGFSIGGAARRKPV